MTGTGVNLTAHRERSTLGSRNLVPPLAPARGLGGVVEYPTNRSGGDAGSGPHTKSDAHRPEFHHPIPDVIDSPIN